MNWWLFVQIVFLLIVLAILISFIVDSAIDKIYQGRQRLTQGTFYVSEEKPE